MDLDDWTSAFLEDSDVLQDDSILRARASALLQAHCRSSVTEIGIEIYIEKKD
jgi:hypothetical protein